MILICLVALTSCSVLDKSKGSEEEVPSVEELYNEAHDKLKSKKYKQAIEKFEEVERTYPYAKWAIKSQVMSAYASYQGQEYDDALNTLERFIKLHPGNENIPYAYYLRALCYYEQISDVDRDQSYSLYSQKALKEVIARFPDSDYARDSEIKLDLVVDHLAGKEVTVGRFYLKKHQPISAINRFKVVVQEYQTTIHIQEALHRLVEAYLMLGVVSEAQKYASVLGHNYPESKWYQYSYKLLKSDNQDAGLEGAVIEEKDSFFKFTIPSINIPFFSKKNKERESIPPPNI